MIVKVLPHAEKDARKLGAMDFFKKSLLTLMVESLENMERSGVVRRFSGSRFEGVFEVKVNRYRTIFVSIQGETATVLAFFKKEGDRLKKSQLAQIAARAAFVRRAI